MIVAVGGIFGACVAVPVGVFVGGIIGDVVIADVVIEGAGCVILVSGAAV